MHPSTPVPKSVRNQLADLETDCYYYYYVCHDRVVDRPALLAILQTRVESGCSRSYLGMFTTDCSKITTDMFALLNTSASLVCECCAGMVG